MLIGYLILPSIFVIAIMDYVVLSRWALCPACKKTKLPWYYFIVPTILEMLCILVGVIIGKQ